MTETRNGTTGSITRRDLLSGAGATALSLAVVKPQARAGTQANSRIKAGVIGLGSRGRMIAGMVQKHGGYEITAVADYFPSVVDTAAEQLGVPPTGRFSGLATILGREAARRRTKLTLDEVIHENRRLEPDLSGLKA